MIEVPLLAVAALAVLGQGHQAAAARPAGERAEIEMPQGQPTCQPSLHASFLPVYDPDAGGYAVVVVQVRRGPLPCPEAPTMPPVDLTVRVFDPTGGAIAEGHGQFAAAHDEATVPLDRPVTATSVARVEAVTKTI